MRVLSHAYSLCKPAGILLDLTTVPPAASIECAGTILGRLEQDAFLAQAATTEAVVDRFIADGLLLEEGRLEHHVLKYFDDGGDLIADIDPRKFAYIPPDLIPVLERLQEPVAERASCLWRRLRVLRR